MTIVSNVKQCLATIKSIEGQLSTLALNAHEKNTAKVFHDSMLEIEEIKADLEQRLKLIEKEEPQYRGS